MTKSVVLVTGGGSGIGAGIVALLAATGWQVVSTGRRVAALEQGAGANVAVVVSDIADRASVFELLHNGGR